MSEIKTLLPPSHEMTKDNVSLEKDHSERVIEELNKKYDELPINGEIELRLSMINPIDGDNCIISISQDKLIETFKGKSGKIYIKDGNQRYFKIKSDLRIKKDLEFNPNGNEGIIVKDEDLGLFEIPIIVKKVDPDLIENAWLL
jgi:hypothetical protein